MSLLDELHARREEILALAARYGLSDVRVFGSVARREEHARSDVDFLIRPSSSADAFDVMDFSEQICALLGKRVDVVSEDGLYYALKENVLREALPL